MFGEILEEMNVAGRDNWGMWAYKRPWLLQWKRVVWVGMSLMEKPKELNIREHALSLVNYKTNNKHFIREG